MSVPTQNTQQRLPQASDQLQQGATQGAQAGNTALRAPRVGGSYSSSQQPDGSRWIEIPNDKGGVTRVTLDRDNQVRISVNTPGMPSGDRVVFAGQPSRARDIPNGVATLLNNGMVTFVLLVIGFPFARAIARMIDRRSATPRADTDTTLRLAAIENAVESIAVEVERISEGQRFTARVLTERTQHPAPEFIGNGVRDNVERANG